MNSFFKLYQSIYEISEIPLCLVENGNPVFSKPDLDTPVYTSNFIRLCLYDYEIYSEEHTGPLITLLPPGYYLAVERLSDNLFLILGPGIIYQFSWKDILPWIESPLFQDNRSSIGKLLMTQKAVNASCFFNTLAMCIYMTTGELPDIQSFSTVDSIQSYRQINSSLTEYIFDARESYGFHTPYSLEVLLTQAVEAGNIHLLKKALHQQTSGRLGILSTNPDRQVRYMFVTAVAVFGRAATRGGLDYEQTCSLEDIYCQRMDAMTTPAEILRLHVNVNIKMYEKWKIIMYKKYPKKLQNPLQNYYLNIVI